MTVVWQTKTKRRDGLRTKEMIDMRIAAHLLFFERDSDVGLEVDGELDNGY
jgi:hypothetical protein